MEEVYWDLACYVVQLSHNLSSQDYVTDNALSRFSLNFLCRYWYALCVQLNLNPVCSPLLLLSWVFYCQHINILSIQFFLIMTNANKDVCMCLYMSLLMFIFSDKANWSVVYWFEWLVLFFPGWTIRCIMAPHLVHLILWIEITELAIVTVPNYDIISVI
jgi:hypothetical protein